jgi:type II secretory pathway pseudopilin PulG
MRLVAVIVILAVIALVIAISWYLVIRHGKTRERRRVDLAGLERRLSDINTALGRYTPFDHMGHSLSEQVSGYILGYHKQTATERVSQRKRIRLARAALANIATITSVTPPSLLDINDDGGRVFLRDTFHALNPNADKEIAA